MKKTFNMADYPAIALCYPKRLNTGIDKIKYLNRLLLEGSIDYEIYTDVATHIDYFEGYEELFIDLQSIWGLSNDASIECGGYDDDMGDEIDLV